jgi:RHS repeat-associated protein
MGQAVVTDRLGSVRWHATAGRSNYYPYGEERTGTGEGREKFGTYVRDGDGLDYADQRYYGPGTGRFLTADPYQASGGAEEPGSWNRYAYVGGDPVNWRDVSGLSRDTEDDSGLDMQWVNSTMALNLIQLSRFFQGAYGNVRGDQRVMTQFSNDMRGISHGAVAGMPAKCKEALGTKWNVANGTSSLLFKTDSANANAVRFYDARNSNVAGASMVAFGGNPNLTVAQFFKANPQYSAFTGNDSDHASNDIVLSADFFDASPEQQRAVLLHEVLHAYTGKDDVFLASALGLGEFVRNVDASAGLSDYFANGCDMDKYKVLHPGLE